MIDRPARSLPKSLPFCIQWRLDAEAPAIARMQKDQLKMMQEETLDTEVLAKKTIMDPLAINRITDHRMKN